MVKPYFLTVFVFRHYADGLALLDSIAAYDANGTDILSPSFDITSFVHCFFNEFLPLSPDRFSVVIVLGVNIFNPLHCGTFLPSIVFLMNSFLPICLLQQYLWKKFNGPIGNLMLFAFPCCIHASTKHLEILSVK